MSKSIEKRLREKAIDKLNSVCEHLLNSDSQAPGVFVLASTETVLAIELVWRKISELEFGEF